MFLSVALVVTAFVNPVGPAVKAFLLVFAAALAAMSLFWVSKDANTGVQIYPDRFVLHRGGTKTDLPFEQMESVKFFTALASWPGFQIHMRDGKSYWIDCSLERSEYLLDALTAAQPLLVETKTMEEFRVLAVLADHSWARWYVRMSHYYRLASMYVAMPMAVAYVSGLSMERLFLLGLLAGSLTYTVFDYIIRQDGKLSLQENPLHAIRNLEFEGRMFQFSDILHVVLFLIFSILYLF